MADDAKVTRQRFAHALLSPLTVILGSVEMLKNQAAAWPDYAKELLELALAQGQRLQSTLTDLIATAEIEGDTVRVSWSARSTSQAEGQLPATPGQQTGEKKKV
jgi:signal transduction histidine kinase